jgi:molecular chaperone DnaK
VFHTVYDRQDAVDVDVYQGESDDVRDNFRVGRFRIQGLAPVPAGNQLVVQLDLNLDGILTVTARERATGLSKQITIENALSQFVTQEREGARDRLERLWGREDEDYEDEDDLEEGYETEEPADEDGGAMPELVPGPREGQREVVQARALLEKAERLLDKASPEDQEEVKRLMDRVRNAITDRQWDKVTAATNELADVLFYLEDQ